MGIQGFLGGALSSAGASGMRYYENRAKEEADLVKVDRMAELQKQAEVDREARIEAKRVAKTARIEEARGGIIESRMSEKYAPSDSAVAEAERGTNPLTAEQKATIKLSKGNDRAALDVDKSSYIDAAIKTGDIDILEVAKQNALDRAARVAERKQLWKESADERRLEQGDRKLDQQDRRLNATLATIGKSQGASAQSAFIQGVREYELAGYTKKEALDKMASARSVAESHEVEREVVDPSTGEKTKFKEKRQGPMPATEKPASPPSAAGAAPWKKY